MPSVKRFMEHISSLLRRQRNLPPSDPTRTQDLIKPTLDDVYYCYRLFWQRVPGPDEVEFWRQHLASITLQTLIENFVDHEEFRALEKARGQATVVALENFKLCVRLKDWVVGAPIAVVQSYEPHVTREMQAVLKPGMVLVDLGANIGYYSMLGAARVGKQGKVLAFEPNPDNCDLIRQSVALNNFENVVLYQCAVADREGVSYLGWDFNATHSNTVVQSAMPVTGPRVTTQTVVLDKVLEHETKIDVVKIDIEGGEALALKGMTQVLQRCRPVIFTEFFPALIERFSKVAPESYLEDIQKLGYRFHILPFTGNKVPLPYTTQQVMDYWRRLDNPTAWVDLVAYPS